MPKWSSTLKRSEGKMPPLGKLVMGSSWLSEALMAAASLARSPPNPSVELLPSQSAQLLGVVLPLLAASASALQQRQLAVRKSCMISWVAIPVG